MSIDRTTPQVTRVLSSGDEAGFVWGLVFIVWYALYTACVKKLVEGM